MSFRTSWMTSWIDIKKCSIVDENVWSKLRTNKNYFIKKTKFYEPTVGVSVDVEPFCPKDQLKCPVEPNSQPSHSPCSNVHSSVGGQ